MLRDELKNDNSRAVRYGMNTIIRQMSPLPERCKLANRLIPSKGKGKSSQSHEDCLCTFNETVQKDESGTTPDFRRYSVHYLKHTTPEKNFVNLVKDNRKGPPLALLQPSATLHV